MSQENQIRLRLALEVAQVVCWEQDLATGKILLFGKHDRDRWLAENWELLAEDAPIHPDDLAMVHQAVDRAMKTQGAFEVEHRVIFDNFEPVWMLTKGKVIVNDAGQPEKIIGATLNIHNRKQAEEQLQLQARLLDAVDRAIIATDLAGTVIYWNRGAEELYGWLQQQALGRSVIALTVADSATEQATEVLQRLQAGERWSGEFQLKRRDGTQFLGMVADSPVLNEQGELIGIIGVSADISAQRVAERALQQREQQLSSITNAIPGAVYQFKLDAAGNTSFTYISDGARSLYELDPEQIVENIQVLWNLIESTDLVDLERSILASADTLALWEQEYRILTPSGVEKWVQGRSLPHRTAAGEVVWDGIFLDISDRKRTEFALKQSEQRFRNTAANIPGAIFRYVLRADGTDSVTYMSRGCYDLWEVNAEAVEESAAELWEMIHPEDLPGMQQSVLASAETLAPWAWEWRIVTPSGKLKWLRGVGHPQRLVNGDVSWDSLILDVSDRKRTEVELQQAKVAAESASAAKTEFLANMSHEVRTPMNAILGFAELLQYSDLTADQQEYIESIRQSGELMLTIINDILDLSKLEVGELTLSTQPFDPYALIDSVTCLFQRRLAMKRLELAVEIDPAVPRQLTGPFERLQQVLINFMSNAIKFTESGGIILTVACTEQIEPAPIALKFSVQDTGRGIAPENCDRIFDPFMQGDSSASKSYEGTGLGLAICKRITDLMGGKIGVDSLVGHGSTFWFTVPLHYPTANEERSPAANAIERDAPDVQLAPRVLVVEDNPSNRKVLLAMLRKLGYRADWSVDGQQALAKLLQQAYDLILMDCQMPLVDGYDATRQWRRQEQQLDRQRTPIIGITAYAMSEDRQKCLNAGMDDYLSKPVTLSELSEMLAHWVGGGNSSR